jgi:Leucine-rich repeat (LRR) protein
MLLMSKNANLNRILTTIGDIEAVKVLDLSHCNFGGLDLNNFLRMTSLEELLLNDNKISEINCSNVWESNMNNLHILSLERNQLSKIANETFECTPMLLDLFLNGNKLTKIYKKLETQGV